MSDDTKRELLTAAGVTLGGAGLGGIFGALDAPKGHKLEGAMRAATAGAPVGLSGYALASGLKGMAVPTPNESPYWAAAKATGGLVGADSLIWGGKSLPRMLYGRPSWEVRTDNLHEYLGKEKKKAMKKTAGVVSDTVGSVPGLGWMQTDNVGHPFAKALQEVAEGQMKQDAMGDIGNIGLAGLGVGAGAAGVAGLARLFKKKKNRTTNPVLPLPFPVEPSQMPERFISKKADITTRAAIPWYGPAMMASGMGGMALGWGGIDSVLKAKAKKDREAELEAARSEFHDAMLSQYDKPLKAPAKTAGDDELGRELDRLFDLTQQALEKKAMNMADAGGMALGGYGMYAGLTGLLTGSVVYNQMKKRSRAAILEKAMQKRERRKFMQSPPEIYAVPEPMSSPLNGPGLSKADARLLKTSPEDFSFKEGSAFFEQAR